MSKATKTEKEETKKEENTEEKPVEKSSKAKEEPVNKTKFIGFSRASTGGPWTLLNAMLSSAESVEHKIKLFKGECEIHVIEIDLPD